MTRIPRQGKHRDLAIFMGFIHQTEIKREGDRGMERERKIERGRERQTDRQIDTGR